MLSSAGEGKDAVDNAPRGYSRDNVESETVIAGGGGVWG